MSAEDLTQKTLEGFERLFGRGDLSTVDEMHAQGAVDHQEPEDVEFAAHIKDVVTVLREGLPDLRFEVHQIVQDGDIVATRSTMSGTHLGRLALGPLAGLAPTGRKVAVQHMHFFRYQDGRVADLWHVWDTLGLLRQLGVPAPDLRVAPPQGEPGEQGGAR